MRKMLREREREREVKTNSEIAWYILLYIWCILTSCWHYYTLRNLLSHVDLKPSSFAVSIIRSSFPYMLKSTWDFFWVLTWDTLLMMQLNSLYGDLPFDFIGRKMSNGNFVLNTYHLKFYYLNFEGETQFILWKGVQR